MTLLEKMNELVKNNQNFVLATVVKTGGSVPGKVGFKILVEPSGETVGTVGGGALEKEVIQESRKRLKEEKSGLQEYILSENPENLKSRKDIPIIPMMCNGEVTVYYEIHRAAATVYLFGGGHVSQALSYFLHRLGYHICLIDNREEFANSRVNPNTHEIIYEDYSTFASKEDFKPGSFITVMTHGHQFDYDIARIILQRGIKIGYLGIIASKSKAHQLRRRLKNELGGKTDLSVLYTPIGLDLGGDSDAEIALAIAAEIQTIAKGKEASHLSGKV